MTSLNYKLYRFGAELAKAVDEAEVYHYFRPQLSAPFCVWAEDGEADSFDADNSKAEQTIHGTADYFTKLEYDPVIDAIQDFFCESQKEGHLAWRLLSVQFEDDTNLIHYEWEWELT